MFGAQPHLIELPRSSIGVGHCPESIPDVRVGDGAAVFILPVEEPQPAAGHQSQHHFVQRLHVAALALGLGGEVLGDLRVHRLRNGGTCHIRRIRHATVVTAGG